MKELKSELFNNSYCIFVDKKTAQTYKPIVEKYKEKGVRIIEGNFENSPACIVIPDVLNFCSLEKQLLESVEGLTECAIFGVDRVKCLYVGSCNEADIINFLGSLGTHCRPVLVKNVDAIPLSPSGKVSRSLLDSLY